MKRFLIGLGIVLTAVAVVAVGVVRKIRAMSKRASQLCIKSQKHVDTVAFA